MRPRFLAVVESGREASAAAETETSRGRKQGSVPSSAAPPARPPPSLPPEKERNRSADTAAGARDSASPGFRGSASQRFFLLSPAMRRDPTPPTTKNDDDVQCAFLPPPALSARALSARALATVRRVRPSSATPRRFRGRRKPPRRQAPPTSEGKNRTLRGREESFARGRASEEGGAGRFDALKPNFRRPARAALCPGA